MGTRQKVVFKYFFMSEMSEKKNPQFNFSSSKSQIRMQLFQMR